MAFIVKTAYLVASLYFVGKLYIWFGGFKGVSLLNVDQVNEDRSEDECLDVSDVKNVNKFGLVVFVIFGTLIWAIIGLTIGRIAADITYHNVFCWVIYILMYILFLRLPLGFSNHILKEYYEIKNMPETALFSIIVSTFYVIGICYYDAVPRFFRWHLYFLN